MKAFQTKLYIENKKDGEWNVEQRMCLKEIIQSHNFRDWKAIAVEFNEVASLKNWVNQTKEQLYRKYWTHCGLHELEEGYTCRGRQIWTEDELFVVRKLKFERGCGVIIGYSEFCVFLREVVGLVDRSFNAFYLKWSREKVYEGDTRIRKIAWCPDLD